MKIGFIGAGNMAYAILKGLAKNDNNSLMAYDIDQSKALAMEEIGVAFLEKEEVISNSEVIVLAIKPYHYHDFIVENKDLLSDKLVVSIAAGITEKFLMTLLGHKRFVRVMPNTPALIGNGVTGICKSEDIDAKDFEKVVKIFEVVGRVEELAPNSFDAIIPVTGSSPAYTFMYIDELIKIGLQEGFEYQSAKVLACEAVIGAAKLFLSQEEKANILVDKVCSKGGTTIEGVKSLKEDDFSQIMSRALNRCLDRAKEMNDENDNTL